MKVVILTDDNFTNLKTKRWISALGSKQIQFKLVNLLTDDFLTQIKTFDPHFCVTKPPGDVLANQLLFTSRLNIIETEGLFCFPSYDEVSIYENKFALASFLVDEKLPHPKTTIFDTFENAMLFAQGTTFPVVAKTFIGASGTGVQILKSKEELEKYIHKAFHKGIRRKFGPNKNKGNWKSWLYKAIKSPNLLIRKLKSYKKKYSDVQKGFVLFQEFIPHDFEWRIVKIGCSFFGYKKLNLNEKSSGSGEFEYGKVPKELLNFVKEICEKYNYNSMAIDIFEHNNNFLINEMQTLFGHANPYICKVDNHPGRYLFIEGKWVFEEGNFNSNESYDLRLETAIERYKKSLNKA